MSRIAISEEDLDAGPNTPVTYGPVGGTTHPNVYGPVPPATQATRAYGDVAVATWVLVTAAVVLSVTFGVGGFFAGRAGQISQSEQRAKLKVESTRLEAQRVADVADARAATRKAEQARANARVERARDAGYAAGRAAGLSDGREEGRNDVRSYADSCLTSEC